MIVDLLPCVEDDVRVRCLEHRDAGAFSEGTKDSAVQSDGHLPLAEYTPQIVREQIDGPIRDGLADGSLAVLAIADRHSDAFLGSVVLFNSRPDRAEVGYWLGPWARGRGAAQKALRAVAHVAGELGLAHLDAKTAPSNETSRRALVGAGFRQVGDAGEETAPSGEVVRVLTYERSVRPHAG